MVNGSTAPVTNLVHGKPVKRRRDRHRETGAPPAGDVALVASGGTAKSAAAAACMR